eukprot:CAMPEP_0170610118 /NCGR_PEP_ID=MMETSP0224-20130122/22483_1 /TAXON_ID=285029 /ORGANISM="Togula jolla, Strain CCCM 725" /LENGTH=663 /DNA_ID=CAMNT_0010935461 /DNA_START=1 /DNA_END=1989 /DNA_ORIENTATION=+
MAPQTPRAVGSPRPKPGPWQHWDAEAEPPRGRAPTRWQGPSLRELTGAGPPGVSVGSESARQRRRNDGWAEKGTEVNEAPTNSEGGFRYLLQKATAEVVDESRKEQELLHAQVRRLASEVRALRIENEDLRRASKHHAAMVRQMEKLAVSSVTSPSTASASASAVARPRKLPALGEPSTDPTDASIPANVDPGLLAAIQSSPVAPMRPCIPPAAPSATSARCSCSNAPATGASPGRGGFAQRCFSSTMALWRETTPRGILFALLRGAEALLKEAASPPSLTIYVADAWLRGAIAEEGTSSGGVGQQLRPAAFYLPGPVTLHALRRDGVRAGPPHFPDLASHCGAGSCVALPLQPGPGQPALGTIQVQISASAPSEAAPGAGRSWAHAPGHGEEQADVVVNKVMVLTDSQTKGLEMLCNLAAAILDLRRQLDVARALRALASECLTSTTQVYGARDLVAFEEHVKPMMAKLFGVESVRLSFYQCQTQELLSTATRRGITEPVVGRRNITRVSIREGIVGRCARRRQVVHLEKLDSPYISEIADGVEMHPSRHGKVNMLAGAFVAGHSDGHSDVMGTLQLIHKKRSLGAGVNGCSALAMAEQEAKTSGCCPFTEDDQQLFKELLPILGLACHRTIQMQTWDEANIMDLAEISIEGLLTEAGGRPH